MSENRIANPEEDTHAHIRFYKLLQVAFNSAQNGHYAMAAQVAQTAVDYYEDVDVEASVERRDDL